MASRPTTCVKGWISREMAGEGVDAVNGGKTGFGYFRPPTIEGKRNYGFVVQFEVKLRGSGKFRTMCGSVGAEGNTFDSMQQGHGDRYARELCRVYSVKLAADTFKDSGGDVFMPPKVRFSGGDSSLKKKVIKQGKQSYERVSEIRRFEEMCSWDLEEASLKEMMGQERGPATFTMRTYFHPKSPIVWNNIRVAVMIHETPGSSCELTEDEMTVYWEEMDS